MSFREAILMPMSLFKKCRIEEQLNIENKNSTPSDILDDQRLYPSDKIKLYNQERIMKQNTDKQDSATNQYTTMPLEETELLRNITEKNKPYAKSILDFMRQFPDELGWDRYGRIRIGSHIIPNSDLSLTLQYFTNNAIITNSTHIPPGSLELETKLIDVGVPKSWIIVKRPISRNTRAKKQKASHDWSLY